MDELVEEGDSGAARDSVGILFDQGLNSGRFRRVSALGVHSAAAPVTTSVAAYLALGGSKRRWLKATACCGCLVGCLGCCFKCLPSGAYTRLARRSVTDQSSVV